MKRIIALVPLRGGSKTIPKKNIKPIAGKPLCYWVLQEACLSKVFERVIVSTDCDEIASVVYSLNLNVEIMKRPEHLAADDATTESVMHHVAQEIDFDIITTIQATSPLVKAEDFINAMHIFKDRGLDSLLTGIRMKRFFWTEQGTPLNYDPLKRPMRQQFQGTIMENGAFYITRREILEKYHSRLGGKIGIYVMPDDTALELDEPEDWSVVQALLKEKIKKQVLERLKIIKLLAMDCDGVLTDAGMYYSAKGEELKKFNTRDGQGLTLIKGKGINAAIITGESSLAVKRRAEKLGIDELYLGVNNKKIIIQKLIEKYKLKPDNVAYIGDDINDLSAMELAGFTFAVNDGLPEIKKTADYILTNRGGQGAVREACNMIIESLA